FDALNRAAVTEKRRSTGQRSYYLRKVAESEGTMYYLEQGSYTGVSEGTTGQGGTSLHLQEAGCACSSNRSSGSNAG
ncbi:hypothetical protein PIB30_088408, partial [Stylosanthes scabra]|nr:hypothetical protein [Stylosanthes scabra]